MTSSIRAEGAGAGAVGLRRAVNSVIRVWLDPEARAVSRTDAMTVGGSEVRTVALAWLGLGRGFCVQKEIMSKFHVLTECKKVLNYRDKTETR
jgi:hypothetical protein